MKRPLVGELNPSRLAALGFFVLIGLVANVIQVTQSIAAGEFSILTISVGVLVVVFVVVLGRGWLKARQETVREAGAPDKIAVVVAVCLAPQLRCGRRRLRSGLQRTPGIARVLQDSTGHRRRPGRSEWVRILHSAMARM